MGRTRAIGLGLVLLIGALNLVACATTADQGPSLYKRLNGREGIALVVGDFVTNMAGDARVSERFKAMKPADVEKLKSHLSDQICDATGGPCSYVGRDMKTTHKGMGISDTDFNALVEDLVKSLDKFKVPEKEKGELLGVLGPMKPSIVGQ